MDSRLFAVTIIIAILVLGAIATFIAMLVVRSRTMPADRPKKLLPWWITASSLLALVPFVWLLGVIIPSTFKPADMGNPFFSEWTTPFGMPPFDQIRPEHFAPAFEEGMRVQRAEIDLIKANVAQPDFENVILAYDRSGELYHRVARVFSGLTAADTNPALDEIKTAMSPLQSAHSDAIMMDSVLFAKVRSVYDRRHGLGLDAAKMRLTELVYKRFARSGALLSPEAKAEMQTINEELAALSVRFGSNRRAQVKSYRLAIDSRDGTSLPAGVSSAAASRAKAEGLDDQLVFTLSKPSWLPLVTYSDKEPLRRDIYEAWLGQCAAGTEHDNTQIINDIARMRGRKAQLMGYATYADYVLDDRMAATPAKVYELLDDIWTPALAKATKERDELQRLKRTESSDTTATLNSWDWWYYAERERKNRYAFDEMQVRPYFSLENVRSGIFKLCNRLYGISLRPIAAPVYHKDVAVYEVLDIDNSHLGVVCMDFFPRPGKSAGAWCGTYRSQGYTPNGRRIAPIVTVVCNFTEPLPGSGTPSLLTLDEVETFFHEFGHALHNLFADVPYEGLLGVERDFVELPSQIMENWAFEPQLLAEYAIHYRTGERIPPFLVEQIASSGGFNQGFATVELLAASYSDMDIHSVRDYKPFDVAEFERAALVTRRGLIPQIAPRYHYPYFSHIFDGGYAAGYYGYIWAEVLDKDAYEAFVESGDRFSRTVAERFRRTVLAPRGLRDGMQLYRDFRGAEPSRQPLFRARGLVEQAEVSADSLAARQALKPQPTPSDSLLRIILGEEPLKE